MNFLVDNGLCLVLQRHYCF